MKPAFRLKANKVNITEEIAKRFVSLSYTDEAGLQSDALEIVLDDTDDTAPLAVPAVGAELELWLGYDDKAERMGLFIVDDVGAAFPPATMTIKAKATPQAASGSGDGSTRVMLTSQKSRSWPAGTLLGDMVKTIAAEHGLVPAVANSLAGISLPHIDQTGESDMSLLTRIAKDYGAIAKPADGRLVLAPRGQGKTVSGQSLPVVSLKPEDVTSGSVEITKRQPAGTVIAVFHDNAAGQAVEVMVGNGEPVHRIRHQYSDRPAAQKGARAEFDRRQASERRCRLTMPGRPSLVAEAKVSLSEFRPAFNRQWIVTRGQHSLTPGGGYTCNLALENMSGD